MNGILFVLLAAVPNAGQNWPQFRGPHGDGHADAKNLPIQWSERKNVRWKTPIPGKAWSSPVVWGNRVWLSNATEDGKELSALALDIDSGEVMVNVTVFTSEKPAFCHPTNSHASGTPCLEEGRVYVHYGSAGTACLDVATGKTLWSRRDLPCDHFRGAASSPILFGDNLYLTFDGFDRQYVVALDKKTGETVWNKARDITYGTTNGDGKKAYSTPTVIEVQGKPQLVSPAAVGSIAFDPFTGAEIWKVHHGGMNAAAPPLFAHGKVFITTGDGGWKLFAVRPDGKGDVSASHVDWKFSKAVPSRSSPLLVGDLIYLINETGVVSLVEAKTGNLVRQERLRGAFWASPLYADGHIYFFNEDGGGFVVEPGQDWKVVGTNQLAGGCMASPAAVGKKLIVRTKTHLYCLENK